MISLLFVSVKIRFDFHEFYFVFGADIFIIICLVIYFAYQNFGAKFHKKLSRVLQKYEQRTFGAVEKFAH